MTHTNEKNDATNHNRDKRSWLYRYSMILVMINSVLLFAAWRDRSWDAFAIAIIYGPAINFGLAGTALWRIFKKRKDASVEPYMRPIILILLAIAAAILDGIAIFSMGLSGG